MNITDEVLFEEQDGIAIVTIDRPQQRNAINRGVIDLAQLRAEELYDSTSTLATIEHRLDDLEQNGGWLIFYTHDVRHDPTAIGCSPSYFAKVVESVRRRRIAVETVAATLERIGASGRKARS